MILKYDSVLGIPTVEQSGSDSSNNISTNGLNLGGMPSILIFVGILLLFILLFSGLGKKRFYRIRRK